MVTKTEYIKDLIKNQIKHKFFTITFLKQNGEVRKMTAQYGVKKGIKGYGAKKSEEFNLVLYDHKVRGHRSIKLESVQSINCGVIHYESN